MSTKYAEDLMRRGLSPDDARRRAHAEFGSVDARKEACREALGLRLLDEVRGDVRYAVRLLRRTPAFTTIAVLCLALGIGANTAIFTLVDATLLRTLPVAEPERLVVVQSLNPRGEGGSSFSYPQFAYLREHTSAVGDIFAYARIDLNLSAGDFTDAPRGLLVSDNYFSALGVPPAIGRGFAPSDELVAVLSWGPRFFETMGITVRLGRDFSPGDRSGYPGVAIINETIARTYFAGVNPIGRHVGLGGTPDMDIVGVIADTKYRDLREPVPNTLYLPIDQAPSVLSSSSRTLHVRTFADPGGMATAVREQVRALDQNLPVTISLFADLVDDNLVRERLMATLSGFFGGLALLLTSLGLYGVIAYGVQRRAREIGIRMSLGADRAAVLWMVLRECLVLVGLGIAAGALASLWLSRLVSGQLFGVTPGDPVTIAAASLILVTVAALAAYMPARRAARVDPLIVLRE